MKKKQCLRDPAECSPKICSAASTPTLRLMSNNRFYVQFIEKYTYNERITDCKH